jgi:anthranilate phosphoribosyltransferase
MTAGPHPFARFVAILGRGKSLTRSLSEEEAEEAMAMILAGDVLPEQLGAFLMLLRVKEESPAEIAGFVRAARKTMPAPAKAPRVDLDWSSYAGKRRQLPWFLLSTLLIARAGWRVFMHGAEGHTSGRLYTRDALLRLGLPVAGGLDEAAAHLVERNFAYVSLDRLSPKLAAMMALRPILGLRSPAHTVARMLNPFAADCVLQGVFHPGYMELHRRAGALLGERRLAVLRGEGGEIERRPNKPCEVLVEDHGTFSEERWPPMIPQPRQPPDGDMDVSRLDALWRGDAADAYAEAAITGTLAIALKALGAASDMGSAQARADALWRERDRSRFGGRAST